jgi:argininosuccinate lyase
MQEALQEGFLTATDFCEYLVEKGVPFREAHALVGEIVKKLALQGRTLRELTREDLGAYGYLFEEALLERLREETSIERRVSFGSASRKEVAREIETCKKFLTQKEDIVKLWQDTWWESFRKLVGE